MKQYCVKVGQTNFRPIDNPLPRFRCKGFAVQVRFTEDAWWSIDEVGGDADHYDELKLKGLTNFFSANNEDTVWYTWRPLPEKYTWRVTPYLNYPKSKAVFGDPVTVTLQDVFDGVCGFRSGGKVEYTSTVISNTGTKTTLVQSFDFKPAYIMRETGTYFGGANNAEGPFGGKAHKDMCLFIDFNVLR